MRGSVPRPLKGVKDLLFRQTDLLIVGRISDAADCLTMPSVDWLTLENFSD